MWKRYTKGKRLFKQITAYFAAHREMLLSFTVFFCCAFLVIFTVHTVFFRDIAIESIFSSTMTSGADTPVSKQAPKAAPAFTVDRSTVETTALSNYWIAPPGKPAWIECWLDDRYTVDSMRILNTRHGLRKDAFTIAYRVVFTDSDGAAIVFEDKLPPYPDWQIRDFGSSPLQNIVSARIELTEMAPQGGGLNEVVFLGVPSGASAFRWRLILLLMGAALLALAATILHRKRNQWFTPPRLVFFGLSLLLCGFGIYVLRYTTSVSAFEWGLLFNVTELSEWEDITTFFKHLMVPIPANLALFEIIVYKLTGNLDLSIRYLYKLSIILPYVVVLFLAYPHIGRMVVTFLMSLVFIWGSAIIHPGNPQIYDTVFPLLIMLFVLFQYPLAGKATTPVSRGIVFFCSGFFISMAVLTRPFMIILLVPLLGLVFFQMRPLKRRYFLIFMTPIILFALSWHLFLLINHGQATMSNHTGFNIIRAWPMVERPKLEKENPEPPYRRYNNPTHLQNSRRLQKAVVTYILKNPFDSLGHMFSRLDTMISGKTTIISTRLAPAHPVLGLYRLMVKISASLTLLGALLLLFKLLRGAFFSRVKFPIEFIFQPQTFVILLTAMTLCLVAQVESGEEARFLLSVLPMFAMVPGFPWRELIAPSVEAR